MGKESSTLTKRVYSQRDGANLTAQRRVELSHDAKTAVSEVDYGNEWRLVWICEDELVCQCERSYEDLLNLFPRQKIAHVFATEAL